MSEIIRVFPPGVNKVIILSVSSNSSFKRDFEIIDFLGLAALIVSGGALVLLYKLPKTTGNRGSSFKNPMTTEEPTSGMKKLPALAVA